ncbi:MAG TPA: homoserine dehydrogenase [Burkholderiales bacterium]|nr:homoserine dehydrogenase [Burkholderiales bacterium]
MDHAALLAGSGSLVAAVVGVGEFGASFIFRSSRVPGLRVAAAVDADPARAVRAAGRAGVAADRIVRCGSEAQAKQAFARGDFVVAEDAAVICALDLDFVVEATGSPEAGARTALAAIGAGKHVAMVSKECDSAVGVILQARAAEAGLVYTAVDGDQPSLLVGLVTWARTLGLEILCAGKASEFDFVSESDAQWNSAVRDRDGFWSGRPRRTPPDLCELGIVANATGLKPDAPRLHAPVAKTLELPDLFRPGEEGGLLSRPGVVDLFNCFRRADEASFAGGVFVTVRCDDAATWALLKDKGIPSSADGRVALLHNPVHLLGIEAPITLLQALALKQPAAKLAPRCDLVARAGQPLAAGTTLALGERHTVLGVAPELADAAPARGANPVPYYLAAGCRLRAAVPAGALITREMLEAPRDSALWRLRDEQDAKFFP